jgi:hypothetical protein
MEADRIRRSRLAALAARGLALLPALVLALPGPASAAGFFLCSDGNAFSRTANVANAARWMNRTVKDLTLNTTSFPSGSNFITGISDALVRWNRGPQNFAFSASGRASRNLVFGDGNSDVMFTSGVCGTGAIACAPSIYSCAGGITEVDIVLVPGTGFDLSQMRNSQFAYGGFNFDFRGTLVHELGHAYGLAHTGGVYNVMGDPSRHTHTNGNMVRVVPGEDAVVGAVSLYGARGSAGQDLGASHWRRVGETPGPSGPTSNHDFVRVFDSSGNPLPVVARAPGSLEPAYQLRRGQSVQVEFNLENNGAGDQNNVSAGYFFSIDDTITTGDRRVATGTGIVLTRNTPNLRRQTLTIPLVDATGAAVAVNRTYFLGVIVDDPPALAELDEENATYIPVRVIP